MTCHQHCPAEKYLLKLQDGFNWPRIEGSHYTGALLDVGEEGEWDSLFVAGPFVFPVGPKNMRMYYHSYDVSQQKYAVGLATSHDGLKWEKKGKLFEGSCVADGFDCKGVSFRCVVREIYRLNTGVVEQTFLEHVLLFFCRATSSVSNYLLQLLSACQI